MKINIIGGGIGGLTTAIALQQKGFSVKIYEAAPVIHEVGAGLWVAANAINIFERLGIADEIKKAGNQLESSMLADHNGKPMSKVDFKKIINSYGNGTTTIHRAKLQAILMSHVEKGDIEIGKRLKKIENAQNTVDVGNPDTFGKGPIKVYFEDSTTSESDILIGADGIHSQVREHLFGNIPLRFSNQTCWRGIAKMRLADTKNGAELWGTKGGLRSSYAQINDEEVYWYITKKEKEGTKIAPSEVKKYLIDLVLEFQSDIRKVIQNTDNQAIIQNDLSDLTPLNSWHKGNIVLMGDAAHASTPNLGQGACQAIEDAYVLADCLAIAPLKAGSASEAFLRYERLRMEKANFVIKTSLQIASLNNIGGAIGYRLRNGLMRMIPASVGEKQFDYLFKLNY
jgi:2-polyprenyl-6-methoxyphenol hydroxylase-like FAD-dependent oxidoreductase